MPSDNGHYGRIQPLSLFTLHHIPTLLRGVVDGTFENEVM